MKKITEADFKKIKLAFFDIDGTLLGHSAKLSSRTINAVKHLQNLGIITALATGRPMFGTTEVANQLEIDCFGLFASGALLANPKNSEVLFEASIPKEQILACNKAATELGLYVELYSKDNYFIEKPNQITEKHTFYLGSPPQVSKLSEVVEKYSINKIVVISDNPQLNLKQDELINRFPDLVCLCSKGASHPEITFNNITSQLAERRLGFQKLISYYGVKAEETIAFGDSIADSIFLEMAGIGVAMGNAPDALKNKAQIVTESAENDGVALIIENHF